MQPIPGILLALSGMVGVVGTVLALIGWSERRLAHALSTVPVLRCAELLAGPLPKRVLVEGWTMTGPDGPLVAPLSGEPCIWTRTEARTIINENNEKRKAIVWSHERPNSFRIKDRTGSVAVSPKLLYRAGNERYLNDLIPLTLKLLTCDPPEEPVPAGSIVTVPPDTRPCRDSREAVTRLRARGMSYGLMDRRPPEEFWLSEQFLPVGSRMTVLAKPVRVDTGVELRAPWVGHVGAAGYPLDVLREAAGKTVTDNTGLHRPFLKFAAWLVGAAAVFQLLGWLSS